MSTSCAFVRRNFSVIPILLLPLLISCSGGNTPKASVNADAAPHDRAIADLTEAVKLRPKEANDRGELPHYRRGRAFAEKGEHGKAIADYTEAIRLYPIVKGPYFEPRLAEALSARAESYAKTGEYDKAITDYTEVIQATPKGSKDVGEALLLAGAAATAHYKRGVCYDEKGDRAKAMEDFKEAVRLGPELANNEDLKKRMSK
jgi:tetratricopeptide (TPR) repeat protein